MMKSNENMPAEHLYLRQKIQWGLLGIAFFSSISMAAEKTMKFTYDELGRLTYVEDSVNGNRDYDYDKAGNRCNVAVGTSNDDASKCGDDGPPPTPPPSIPAAPTGLSLNGPYSPTGGYRGSWTAVPGATQYEMRLVDGKTITVSTNWADSPGAKPRWVRAKNSVGTGSKSYF